MDEPSDKPLPPSRLSKTPSWVSLGFVIGALFVWALPRETKTAGTAGESSAAKVPVVQLERPKATDIEAVFAEWGRYAVWDNDLTEVALWDVDRKSYTIFYEILRSGDASYFRSIPRLTRPILVHGVPRGCPLQFTETEEQRREWLARDVTVATPGEGK
jgi:hypothetical protein